MAVLVGVGAATAVGGALMGTLVPQAAAAMSEFDIGSVTGAAILTRLIQATIMFFGTILTLAAFHFTTGRAPDGSVKKNGFLDGLGTAGRLFISITLGVLFAGVYVASLTAMIERLSSLINFTRQLIGL
jgi:heme/copper-type cytochrome/quinol oxidase subunit 2